MACIRSSDKRNLVLFGKISEMPPHSDLIREGHGFGTAANLSFDLENIAQKLDMECRIKN